MVYSVPSQIVYRVYLDRWYTGCPGLDCLLECFWIDCLQGVSGQMVYSVSWIDGLQGVSGKMVYIDKLNLYIKVWHLLSSYYSWLTIQPILRPPNQRQPSNIYFYHFIALFVFVLLLFTTRSLGSSWFTIPEENRIYIRVEFTRKKC